MRCHADFKHAYDNVDLTKRDEQLGTTLCLCLKIYKIFEDTEASRWFRQSTLNGDRDKM